MPRLLDLNRTVPRRFRAFRPRVLFSVGLLLLWALVVAGRAFHLQVLQHDHLTDLAQRQSQRTIRVDGKRGPIEFRDGSSLALSIGSESFYARPSQVENPSLTAFRLARVLDVDLESLETRLRARRAFVWIKRQTSPAEAEAVHALALPGVTSTHEYRRIYPNRDAAAALLGFSGVDGEGLEGLEYAYDSYLKGLTGFRVIDRDALGRTVPSTEEVLPTGGGSIRLTLHPALQHIAERELSAAVLRHDAQVGIAVVLHAPTGEILALAQSPGFNPNDYRAFDKETFFNRAVTSGYEPGSTLKVLTAAIALEEQVVSPDTLFYCENGEWAHYDSVIHDTNPHAWLGLNGIIRVSSNICAAKVGLLLPAGVFREYLGRFGFGSRLGLFDGPDGRRLAAEAEGYLLPEANWTPVDHAAISFGHGILISPLQLATAVNTIATGGLLLKPRLVLAVRDPEGNLLHQSQRTVVRRVISRATAEQVRGMMVSVVEEDGTGTEARVPGYTVAGKTGTTEIYDIKARGYSKTRHIASFVGFVPAEEPVLTILVLVEAPRKGRYGGVVAAPVFSKIAAEALPLLGVWPRDKVRNVAAAAAKKP